MWADLDTVSKQEFREECAALEGTALRNKLQVKLVQRRMESNKDKWGYEAQHLPLEVYAQRGYTKPFLDYIKETAKQRTDKGLTWYAARVYSEASTKEIEDQMETMWMPIPEKAEGAKSSGSRKDKYQQVPPRPVRPVPSRPVPGIGS